MTSAQIVRELAKRKDDVLKFLVDLLVESKVLETKVVEVEKVKEVTKKLSSDAELKLKGKIKELDDALKISQNAKQETADELKASEDAKVELAKTIETLNVSIKELQEQLTKAVPVDTTKETTKAK